MNKSHFVRETMPVTQAKVYLNAGSAGPMSRVLLEALQQGDREDFTVGRGVLAGYKPFFETRARLRETIARLVGASPEEIALTHNTTEGMNIVAHGLDWRPGDEVVTTTLEHEGGLLPVYVLGQRYGVVVKVVELGAEDSPADIVGKLEAAITPKTRLLVYSHVAWNTGAWLPLPEIVAMGHRHGVLSLVDGAQSAGAIDLDLPASGVDFYALPGQKWLCGPEGVGALYVRQDRLHLVAPTFAGFFTLKEYGSYDYEGHFAAAENASRFEVSSVYRPGYAGWLAQLEWVEETVGWDWVYERTAAMFAYAYEGLQTIPEVRLVTRPGPQAGLLCFNLEGYDPARLFTQLDSEGIVLRFIRHPYCLRISTGFYNNEADIDRLADALRGIVERGAEALPEFRPIF